MPHCTVQNSLIRILKQTGLVIKEDLTQIRLEVLKKAIAKYGAKNVWTQNGKIYTFTSNRKKVIQSLDDI